MKSDARDIVNQEFDRNQFESSYSCIYLEGSSACFVKERNRRLATASSSMGIMVIKLFITLAFYHSSEELFMASRNSSGSMFCAYDLAWCKFARLRSKLEPA